MIDISLAPTIDPRVFRFGFACFSESAPLNREVVRDWSRLRLGGFVLAVHPDAELRVVPTLRGTAVVVGEVFAAHGQESVDELLARHVLSGDMEAVDQLSGRFTLLVFTGGTVRVLNDPIGSRSTYYTSRGPRIVGSHASLLASLLGRSLDRETSRYMESVEYKTRRTRYLPGDLTRYRDVVTLIPNNVLDLTSARTSRFWPRAGLSVKTFGEVFTLVDEYLRNYAKFLGRYTPVIGATGGSDSRVLLAGLVAHGLAPRLLTWPGLQPEEMARVASIVSHLNLPHLVVDGSNLDRTRSAELMSISALNTAYTRGRPQIPTMLAEHVGPTDVFIRGYGGEVMRGSWNSAFVRLSGSGVGAMIRQFYTRAVRNPTPENLQYTRAAFEGLVARANIDADATQYDIGDLNYLEQRMPIWAASVMNELDAVMRTQAGLNSRPVYLASMALPNSERFDKQLMFRMVAEYDERLAAL